MTLLYPHEIFTVFLSPSTSDYGRSKVGLLILTLFEKVLNVLAGTRKWPMREQH